MSTKTTTTDPWTAMFLAGLHRKGRLSLANCSKLAMSLDGRDKITKVLQYTCRLLAWIYQSSKYRASLTALKSSLTVSRKAYRLGRSLLEVEKLKKLWKNRRDGPPLWETVGKALKILGLFGFWAGDNGTFLLHSGALDDARLPPDERLLRRKQSIVRTSTFANRCYFWGSVAGLVTNWRIYLRHRDAPLDTDDGDESTHKRHRETQFVLGLALLKSACDVLVFSNNPGIDVWKRSRGHKLHEGLHCLCGLTSAATVLYNAYPDAA